MRKMLQADGEHVKSWTIYSVEYCSISVKYCTHNLFLYIMQGQRVARKYLTPVRLCLKREKFYFHLSNTDENEIFRTFQSCINQYTKNSRAV